MRDSKTDNRVEPLAPRAAAYARPLMHQKATSKEELWPDRLPRQRLVATEFLRFLLVGGVNTLVTYGVYLVLLHWLRYEFAYAAGYALGISTAYALSALFVFRQPLRTRSALRFPLVYVVQFLASLGVLRVAVEIFAVPQWLAFAVSVVLTLPITFVLSRWIVRAG